MIKVVELFGAHIGGPSTVPVPAVENMNSAPVSIATWYNSKDSLKKVSVLRNPTPALYQTVN